MRRPSSRDSVLVVAVLVAAAVVGLVLLREVGSEEPFADYCAEVEERRGDIGAALAAGETTGLIRALPSFEALAEKAPDDIRDEWRTVVTSVRDLRDALDEAGVDAASYDPQKPPADIGAEQREAIRAAALRLGSADTARALAGVEQQARDVCKSPLSL